MFEVLVTHGNQHKRLEVPDDTIVGRAADSEVRLDSWRVGKEHARLYRTPSGPAIEDLGALHGLQVNGQRTALHGPLKPDDRIEIGPFLLQVRDLWAGERAKEHTKEHTKDQTKEPAKVVPITEAPMVSPDTAQRLRLAELEYTWRTRVHERLLELLDLRRKDVSRMSDERLREEVDGLVRDVIAELKPQLPPELDLQVLRKQAINEAVGLGPLEDLLADESVTEIMVNKHDEVYIERGGRLQRHSVCFTSDRAVLGVIERIVAPLGRRIDESSPMVDARLKDGSRVNAIIPPVALKGPTITIRKFAQRKLTCDDLVGFDAISPQMAEFLQVCVEARKNIVVSGGTGSGKTTLLNILANFIPDGERVLTVEDAAELRLNHSHVVSLEARPSNAEGRGAVTIRDLVRNGLRMRPDRIVVGECRGAEALDMLQAMNTGHEGSLTTLHANTPRDALARLETLVLMAGMDLPLVAIREQIASAVDVIVQQARFSCGSRKVTRIVEITGIEQGKLQLQDIFLYEQQGHGANGRVAGRFRGCELVPSFYEALAEAGRSVDLELFKARA